MSLIKSYLLWSGPANQTSIHKLFILALNVQACNGYFEQPRCCYNRFCTLMCALMISYRYFYISKATCCSSTSTCHDSSNWFQTCLVDVSSYFHCVLKAKLSICFISAFWMAVKWYKNKQETLSGQNTPASWEVLSVIYHTMLVLRYWCTLVEQRDCWDCTENCLDEWNIVHLPSVNHHSACTLSKPAGSRSHAATCWNVNKTMLI